jgi:hypothetical protein
MAHICTGHCTSLEYLKGGLKWVPEKLRKLFKFCKKCDLYIKHRLDEFRCRCCGNTLRLLPSAKRQLANHFRKKRINKKIIQKRYRDKHIEDAREYRKNWYAEKGKDVKHNYYENVEKKKRQTPEGRAKHNESSRKYALRVKLLRIFFILLELYPQWNIQHQIIPYNFSTL